MVISDWLPGVAISWNAEPEERSAVLLSFVSLATLPRSVAALHRQVRKDLSYGFRGNGEEKGPRKRRFLVSATKA